MAFDRTKMWAIARGHDVEIRRTEAQAIAVESLGDYAKGNREGVTRSEATVLTVYLQELERKAARFQGIEDAAKELKEATLRSLKTKDKQKSNR